MSTFPSQGALATYWIPEVGIGPKGQMKYVHVPMDDILEFRTNIVFLGFATFTSQSKPYITIPDSIVQQMPNVRRLRDAGIKVLLSISGAPGFGWDNVSDRDGFAEAMLAMIREYGIDGIDIDNEWSKVPEDPQSFMNTVGTLRSALSESLITKALWRDDAYFKKPAADGFPNAGKYLGQMLDFGCSMSYTAAPDSQKLIIRWYHDVAVDGKNVGMPWDRLLIGVQASPSPGFMGIDAVYKLAKWCVEPASPTKSIPPILGMMLYTFSQDIQQWTYRPQNTATKMFPNENDHQWQRTILSGFLGEPKPAD